MGKRKKKVASTKGKRNLGITSAEGFQKIWTKLSLSLSILVRVANWI